MMNAKLLILITLKYILSIHCLEGNPRDATCSNGYSCMPISKCHENNSIVYPCDSDLNHVCCPPQYVDTRQTTAPAEFFSDSCGIVMISDRIIQGKNATLGQFPWMALLGFTQRELDLVQFLCGGSLITDQYVLSAAHCLKLNPNLILSVVRLGEFDLNSEIDCSNMKLSQTCAPPHVDVEVEKIICHENYNNVSYENDISLIKLKNPVNFTLFVLPICLPFQSFKIEKPMVNDQVLISGWGKTSSSRVGGSNNLMYAAVNIWNSTRCNVFLPSNAKPVKDSQICASGENREDSCKGDSGGPMIYSVEVDQDIRNFQIGVISFASSIICGDIDSPTVYTKVEYYLDWITNNVK